MIASTHSQFGQIEDILQQLDSGALEKEEERRGAPRLNVRLSLEALVMAGTNYCPIRIHTRNLSVGGVGFVSRRLLSAGERIAISLHMANKLPKLILAQVTFGRYVRAGMYEMGAKFLEAVDDPKGKGVVPQRWTFSAARQLEEDRTGVGAEAAAKDAAGDGQAAVEKGAEEKRAAGKN